jgi:hypothetical protein
MTPATATMPPPSPLRWRLVIGTLLVLLLAMLLVWSWDRTEAARSVDLAPDVGARHAPLPVSDPLDLVLRSIDLADLRGQPSAPGSAPGSAQRPALDLIRAALVRDLEPRDPIERVVRFDELATRYGLSWQLLAPAPSTGAPVPDRDGPLRLLLEIPRLGVDPAVDFVQIELPLAWPVAAPARAATPPSVPGRGIEMALPEVLAGDHRVGALVAAAALAGLLLVWRLSRSTSRRQPMRVTRILGIGAGAGRSSRSTAGPADGAGGPAGDAPADAEPASAGATPARSVVAGPLVPADQLTESMLAAPETAAQGETAWILTGEARERLLAPAPGGAIAWAHVVGRLAHWKPTAATAPPPPALTSGVRRDALPAAGRAAPAGDPPAGDGSAQLPARPDNALTALLGLAPGGLQAAATLRPLDVAALLREAVLAWSSPAASGSDFAAEPTARPVLDLAPGVVLTAPGDPQVLPLAFRALLAHALSHAHRLVRVTAAIEDRRVVVIVDDDRGVTGAFGLDGPVSTAERHPDRLGLHLTLVHRAARWHGGEALLDDSPLGGRRVSLCWPVSAGIVASADGATPARPTDARADGPR